MSALLIGLLRGVAGLLVRLLLVLLLGFTLFRLIPGDPVLAFTRGHPSPPEQVAALRRELDVDRPVPVQAGAYLARVLHGDLGTSVRYRRPVTGVIAGRLGPTLLLTGTA